MLYLIKIFVKKEGKMEYISHSENETIELGKKLAPQMYKGLVIVLTGDLGSGKTKFTEGILTYYNMQKEISSPTFMLVNEYNTKNLNIYHFDVYRLNDSDEFLAIGGDEYFEKGTSIIEWGERIGDVIPNDYVHIIFSRDSKQEDDDKTRIINIKCNGNTYEKIKM